MNREKPDINFDPSTRDELIHKFEAHNKLGRGAEIGAFKGGFSRDILDVWTGELFLIDIWDQIDIKCPTLILRGQNSDVFPQKNSRKLAEIIDCSYETTIKGCTIELVRTNLRKWPMK